MNDQQPKHVFISYVRENQAEVYRLCRYLKKAGVKVWLDRQSIAPGVNWKDAIRNAIQEGAFFIACFSKEYQSREETHMNEELTMAIERLRKLRYGRVWFIPVLLAECDVPAQSIGAGQTILDINWVPLYEDWDTGIQKILSVIKPIPKDVQSSLSLLNSENENVRQQAVETLGQIGPKAEPAVPRLIEALKDDFEGVRFAAAAALGEIGAKAKKAEPALIEALQDHSESEAVRQLAARALPDLGPSYKNSMPALIEALKDKHDKVRKTAAFCLGEIGLEASAAVPALSEALKDTDRKVREWIEDALEKINSPEA
jgi:hypothetical protein